MVGFQITAKYQRSNQEMSVKITKEKIMRQTDANSSKIMHLIKTKWKVLRRSLDGVVSALLLLTYKLH